MINKLKTAISNRLMILREKRKFNSSDKENIILLEGYPESTNFGDALNKPLAEMLSGKKVVFSKYIKNNELDSFSVIGSVVQSIPKDTTIWGSGLITNKNISPNRPKKVHAVRGPKTRETLLTHGIDCPEVYGDPALLLPLIYNPKKTKKYKYGIIPHYLDKENAWVKKNEQRNDVKIIDLEIGEDYKKVINELQDCENIVTSSLHGLIIAYAYGTPSRWIKLSNKVMGGNFKFNDFLLSIGRKESVPFIIEEATELEDISFSNDSNLNDYNIRPLINSCPFIAEKVKKELLAKTTF